MEAMDNLFSDSDLLFLVETAMPERDDRGRVVALIRNDVDFVEALLSNETVLERLLSDDSAMIRVSPRDWEKGTVATRFAS